MCDLSRQEAFRAAWCDVRKRYATGFIVSERGLQAALYEALGTRLGGESHIVVEPKWEKAIPDLVITRQGAITDIFELKFTPHHCAEWQYDIRKLHGYVADVGKSYEVSLYPASGQWQCRFPVEGACLHFVAVARDDAEAVWPEELKQFLADEPNLRNVPNHITHWYGRTGEKCGRWDGENGDGWGICTVTRAME